MARYQNLYCLIITGALAFYLGRDSVPYAKVAPGQPASPMASGRALYADSLDPALQPTRQGRRNPAEIAGGVKKTKPPTGTGVEAKTLPLPYESGSGGSSASHGIIAVTGSYGVGTSVLYVIDTRSRHIAVYEARGGSSAGRRLTLVGARRIDLDLRLEGYNDRSEYSFDQLKRKFEDAGLPVAVPEASLAPVEGPGKGGSSSSSMGGKG